MFDDNDSLANAFSNLLDYFLFIIKKNKKLFILFIALTFSGSLAHVLTRKPIWLGRTSIQLKNKIKRVERDNVGLEERIASTNDGISNYINEMSCMLDQ